MQFKVEKRVGEGEGRGMGQGGVSTAKQEDEPRFSVRRRVHTRNRRDGWHVGLFTRYKIFYLIFHVALK